MLKILFNHNLIDMNVEKDQLAFKLSDDRKQIQKNDAASNESVPQYGYWFDLILSCGEVSDPAILAIKLGLNLVEPTSSMIT